MVALWNTSKDTPVVLDEYERIAQIVIVKLDTMSFLYIEPPVQASERGKDGFGSTGKVN